MTLIINPGSHVEGGTQEQALLNAREWLALMRGNGITGVQMDETPSDHDDGRWTFVFRHALTGKTAELDTHGLTEPECRALLFWPRVYWKGGSSSVPELSDFLTDGHEIAIVKSQSMEPSK